MSIIFITFKSKQINVSYHQWDHSGVVGTSWYEIYWALYYSPSHLYCGKNKLRLLCKVIKMHIYDLNPSACMVYFNKYT